MAGLGGFGSFAGGFAQTFNSAMHQQQEVQLERQRMQQQQQRELFARADSQRAELWGHIDETIKAVKAAGGDQNAQMNSVSKLVPVLERLTKSSGRDSTLIAPQLSMLIARPSSYDVERGGSGSSQQAAQAAPQQDTAFDQAPQSFTPGMEQGPSPGNAAPVSFMQGDVGGASQPASGPIPPQAASVMGGQQQQLQQPEPEISSVLDEKIERGFRALRMAENPHRAKEMEMKLGEWMRQRSGKDVKTYKADDGSGVYILDTAAGRMKLIPYPEQSEQSQKAQPEPSEYGMATLNPKQLRELDKANVGPKQFDFEAIMAAYGSKQPFVGGGRDKTSGNYKRMVQARAVEYMQQVLKLSPTDAIAAQYEFTAIAHGAVKLEDVAARMTASANNAMATASQVKQASANIPRTEYPKINEAILAWDEQTGSRKIPVFGISLETMAMDYASALGMGNSVITDSRAQHARDLLKKGWSDGQLNAAIDQMLVELDREKGSALRGVHVFIKGAMAEAQGKTERVDTKNITAEKIKSMSTEELEKLQESLDGR